MDVKNKYKYIHKEYEELKKRPTLFRFFCHCLNKHFIKLYNNCCKYGVVFSVLLMDYSISQLLSNMINDKCFDSNGYAQKFNKLFVEYVSFRNIFKNSVEKNKINFKILLPWDTL